VTDRERLDWLERHLFEWRPRGGGHPGYIVLTGDHKRILKAFDGPDLRAAIDEAANTRG